MYLKHKRVRNLALRIMYDLATRVPQVLLHRVEEFEPLARVKLAELMQEPRETGATEQLIESEVVAVDSIDAGCETYNNRVSHEVTIKKEILDDDDDDWYHCVNGSVAKLEIKEEMTFEEHNICIDEKLMRDDLIITDSYSYDEDSGTSLSEDICLAVRCESSMENRSDNSQEALPIYEITKIKREEDDNTVMRYRRFMSLNSKNPNYMVKFPPSVVRRSKKKECSMCKKKFADELMLADHMSIHSGTFTCIMCGEVFQCYGSLKGHIRVHLGERPYLCKCRKFKSICGYACRNPPPTNPVQCHDTWPEISGACFTIRSHEQISNGLSPSWGSSFISDGAQAPSYTNKKFVRLLSLPPLIPLLHGGQCQTLEFCIVLQYFSTVAGSQG